MSNPSTGSVPLRQAIATAGGLSDDTRGMLLGLAGVAIFSLTLPFTRMAVAELPPGFVAIGRALVAALLAALWLRWIRAPLPPKSSLLPLALVAAGCIVGFPWLTSIAMQSVPAAHGAVLIGVLPLATAVMSTLRGNEKPSAGFWLLALAGSALVIGFALRQSGGSLQRADLALFAAVLLAALGYTEGGRLSRSLGGLQTISWALLLVTPLLLPLVLWQLHAHGAAIAAAGARAWAAFAYVSAFSMFLGFYFWYRGMAIGGIARVGQVQLLQPFLSLAGAAVLLGEPLSATHLLFALAVIAVVAAGRAMQVRR